MLREYLYFCTSQASELKTHTQHTEIAWFRFAVLLLLLQLLQLKPPEAENVFPNTILDSRQQTSAYVSIRQHTSAYVSIR